MLSFRRRVKSFYRFYRWWLRSRRYPHVEISVRDEGIASALKDEILLATLPRIYFSQLNALPRAIHYTVKLRPEDNSFAVMLILEYDVQVFPPHVHDYEPIIITGKYSVGEHGVSVHPEKIYYDKTHYFVEKVDISNCEEYTLIVANPWNSYELLCGKKAPNPLLDEMRDIPMLPLEETLDDLLNRSINPLKINKKIITNPWSVEHAEHWSTYTKPSRVFLLLDLITNILPVARIGVIRRMLLRELGYD